MKKSPVAEFNRCRANIKYQTSDNITEDDTRRSELLEVLNTDDVDCLQVVMGILKDKGELRLHTCDEDSQIGHYKFMFRCENRRLENIEKFLTEWSPKMVCLLAKVKNYHEALKIVIAEENK